jgi:hypothetical protein
MAVKIRLISTSYPRASAQGIMGRILAGLTGVVVLVGAFVLSIVLFAFLAGGLLLLGGYLWWTTRRLRKRLQELAHQERVIEGEAVREGDDAYPALRGTQSTSQRPS